MKRMLAGLLCAVLISLSGCGSSGNPEAEAEAVVRAEAWLSLVDGGQYAESWVEAAEYFKGAVTSEQWVQMMESHRKPFGNKISRELQSTSYKTSLPGAPDGEYVVIQFKASFDNKKTTVETITPMMDKDGKWHVSGYYMN